MSFFLQAVSIKLREEIDRVADTTTFNEQQLLDGTGGDGAGTFSLQVGAESGQHIDFTIAAMDIDTLAITEMSADASVADNYATLNTEVKAAIKTVSKQRSDLGAIQNRLEHTINNLDNVVENTTSAESAIRDTDMATEMVKYSNNNILSQAGQAMLAQANQSNQGVLSLLQ